MRNRHLVPWGGLVRSSTSEKNGGTGAKRAVIVVAVGALLGAVVMASPATIWLIVATVAAIVTLLAAFSIGRRAAADPSLEIAPEGSATPQFVTESTSVDNRNTTAAGRDTDAVSSFVVSLARRNGGLVDQQLALLDTLEMSVEDPELLANYFKLDHLATRMRRNADSLLVLAGVDRPRVRAPQDIDEVVRAGISEIEDYRRIDVLALDHVQVTGLAATTLGHLVAELLDNATAFSPPQARVRIAGNSADEGYEILVADSGIGISEDRIDDLNDKLARPPEFGGVGDATIGLTVVSMLAARIGATVQLSRSDHGGTVATVHIPTTALHLGDTVGGSDPLAMPMIDADRSALAMPSLVAEPSRNPMTGPMVEASPFVHASPAVDAEPAIPAPAIPAPVLAPVADDAIALPTRPVTPVAAPMAVPASTTATSAPSSIEVEAANAIARLTLTVSGLPMRPTATSGSGGSDGGPAAAPDSTMGFWPPPAVASDTGSKPPPTALANALGNLHIVDSTEPRPVVEAQPDRIGAAMSSFARLRDASLDGAGTGDRTSH